MMTVRRFFPLLALLVAASQASAGAPVRDQYVEAELVAATTSIQPGQPFTVGLRLSHDPHWHSYWKTSMTGYATSLEWDLPEGFSAGEIQWTVPQPYEMGGLIEYVYEGTVLLPVTIHAPADLAPGTTVTLRATAAWLMCADVCIPGEVELTHKMPVLAAAPEANAVAAPLFAEARARLPVEAAPFETAAWRKGDSVTLALRGENIPGDLYFFDTETFIAPTLTQTTERAGGVARLRFAVDSAGIGETDALRGVLRTGGSWIDGENRPAWALDVALADAPPAWATTATTGEAPRGFLAVLAGAFLGGLILNLMPCVFPVIGIKIMGFVNQAGEARRKVVLHGLSFTLGVLLSFWLLAGTLILLRSGGEQLGWGFQLQNPVFVYLLTVFLFLFALNLSGLFEVGQSAIGVGSGLSSQSGLSGSFFSGILATIVATPCAAPFLAPALGVALALPPASSIVVFTAIALGLSFPYLVLSAFPRLIHYLPRPGAWMESFKQGMSFLLYATAGYLLWVLVGQLVEEQGYAPDALLWTIFGLVLVALAGWTYGRWATSQRPARARRTAYAVAAGLALAGLYLGYPRPAFDPAALAASGDPAVTWEKWEPARASALAAEGRLVYVDFTARWCTTCQVNKKAVFSSAEVRRFFHENAVVALKADWTNADPAISAALESFGRQAVPFNLIYGPGTTEPIRLPELLTPGIVLDRLKDAREG